MELMKVRLKKTFTEGPIGIPDEIFLAVGLRRTHAIVDPPIGESVGYRGDYLLIRNTCDGFFSLSIHKRRDFFKYFKEVKDNG